MATPQSWALESVGNLQGARASSNLRAFASGCSCVDLPRVASCVPPAGRETAHKGSAGASQSKASAWQRVHSSDASDPESGLLRYTSRTCSHTKASCASVGYESGVS